MNHRTITEGKTGGEKKMKKRLQQILSLLCVLALCWTAVGALAEAEVPTEARVLIVEWMDGDNYDGLRTAITASLAGVSTAEPLSEANGWAGEVTVPAGTDNNWTYSVPEGYTALLRPATDSNISVLTLTHATAPVITVSAEVKWVDGDNAAKVRPESVQLALLADGEPAGEPVTAKAPA